MGDLVDPKTKAAAIAIFNGLAESDLEITHHDCSARFQRCAVRCSKLLLRLFREVGTVGGGCTLAIVFMYCKEDDLVSVVCHAMDRLQLSSHSICRSADR